MSIFLLDAQRPPRPGLILLQLPEPAQPQGQSGRDLVRVGPVRDPVRYRLPKFPDQQISYVLGHVDPDQRPL
ncbi:MULTISPECIES: hypothetical protein [unclassified Micromonospora]|uniref:hypothetical protein n=1 Tax=unclassified Micromonospora TaxID=2617518 RepID=UPI0033FF1FD5